MDITIKGRNMDISEAMRDYVEGKASRLDRFIDNIGEAHFDLSVQNARSAQDRQVAQLTLRTTSGVILRVEEHSADMHSSIDAALDKMSRRIKRYKGKHWQTLARGADEDLETEAEEAEVEIVRTKRFQTRPMDVEEAIEQMELLGHDFFAFYSLESGNFNVVYRRRDGGYGLLIPEVS